MGEKRQHTQKPEVAYSNQQKVKDKIREEIAGGSLTENGRYPQKMCFSVDLDSNSNGLESKS